jgi:type II secretory pathway predicted ATPase ExeA
MYEHYFGLTAKPFSLMPDPAFLYMSGQHRRAATAIEYALEHDAGFGLVTGDVGSGKTTLIRSMLALTAGTHTIGLISNTHPDLGPLLPWVGQAFGLEVDSDATRAQSHDRLLGFLLAEYAAGRRVVLVVDEAQNLGPAGLEELRLLSNVNADKHLVLQTLLFGQPELRTLLQRDDLRQFAQRIGIDYHLRPLPREEVGDYVRHRLGVAGGAPDLILDEAADELHAPTGGVPRLINALCDMALVYAFADRRERVDGALMRQVVCDRREGGILPLQRADSRYAGTALAI